MLIKCAVQHPVLVPVLVKLGTTHRDLVGLELAVFHVPVFQVILADRAELEVIFVVETGLAEVLFWEKIYRIYLWVRAVPVDED
jgi:hypothetical protein